jgi:hypothetical protein
LAQRRRYWLQQAGPKVAINGQACFRLSQPAVPVLLQLRIDAGQEVLAIALKPVQGILVTGHATRGQRQ